MTDAGEFIDAALQREGDWYRAQDDKERLASELSFYGASVGAVRGTVRDAERRYPGMSHDEVTSLSSELWAVPVFERRLAAVVLLQSHLAQLLHSDLTRIEGFVRGAGLRALVDPLATDVIGPLIDALPHAVRVRAEVALDRWAREEDVWLRRAVILAPLRSLRTGGGGDANWDRLGRRVRMALAVASASESNEEVADAVAYMRAQLGREIG